MGKEFNKDHENMNNEWSGWPTVMMILCSSKTKNYVAINSLHL